MAGCVCSASQGEAGSPSVAASPPPWTRVTPCPRTAGPPTAAHPRALPPQAWDQRCQGWQRSAPRSRLPGLGVPLQPKPAASHC